MRTFINRFGEGYVLNIILESASNVKKCLEFLESEFDQVTNLKHHSSSISCRVKKKPLSQIYGELLANKEDLALARLSVRMASLDEVRFRCSTVIISFSVLRKTPILLVDHLGRPAHGR